MGDWFDHLSQWLLAWNEPGTLGDVLPWLITSVVTVVAALLTYFSRRAERRREQALQVTAWIDELPRGGWVARIRNSSRDRIEKVALLAGQPGPQPKSSREWDDNAQLFTVSAIGPERSVDFPLAPSLRNQEQPLLRLYFRDRSGQAWLLYETGKLSRQPHSVADSFFSTINTGRRAVVLDHSGTVGADSKKVELADMPISRIDIDPEDGNNISITFVPDGVRVTPDIVVEMQRDGGRVARVYLDADEHLVRMTICNLPPDTRDYAFPQYLRGTDTYTVLFGRKTDSLDDMTEKGRLHSAWVFGGKHTPWGEMAHLGYDEAGHLLTLMIQRTSLMPGFLTGPVTDWGDEK